MVGHYGTPALIAGGLAVALFVVHLAAPFAVEDFSSQLNDAGQEDEVLDRGEMSDRLSAGPSQYGLTSLGLTLTGLIIALVAGAALLVLGFVPMPVAAARFVGWSVAALGAMGAWFALTPSLFATGTGFMTFLGALGTYPDAPARLWIISPVILAVGSVFLLIYFLKVMSGVTTRTDDVRRKASNVLRVPVLAAFFLAAVLVMPWTVLVENGDDRQTAGECTGTATCEGTLTFYSAWGATDTSNVGGILLAADQTQDTGNEMWQGLAFGLKVMIAAAWVSFFIAMVATLGHVITSVTGSPLATKITGGMQLANVVTLPWAAVQFVLAIAYQWKPTWDEAFLDAMPGEYAWWSFAVPLVVATPLLVMWIMRLVQNISDTFGGARDFVESRNEQAVSFD